MIDTAHLNLRRTSGSASEITGIAVTSEQPNQDSHASPRLRIFMRVTIARLDHWSTQTRSTVGHYRREDSAFLHSFRALIVDQRAMPNCRLTNVVIDNSQTPSSRLAARERNVAELG